MLKLGAFINFIIAIGHIVGLFWADKMFEVTGIGKEMAELTQIHFSLPYLLTIFVAIIFFIFGLYGLSADNKFRKLPFTSIADIAQPSWAVRDGAGHGELHIIQWERERGWAGERKESYLSRHR